MSSLSPETPIRLSVLQLIALVVALSGAGVAAGSTLARVGAIETAVAQQGLTLERTVEGLRQVSAAVERMKHTRDTDAQ